MSNYFVCGTCLIFKTLFITKFMSSETFKKYAIVMYINPTNPDRTIISIQKLANTGIYHPAQKVTIAINKTQKCILPNGCKPNLILRNIQYIKFSKNMVNK